MGAVEEGAKVASGVVEGLKTQPALLAMIVANVAMLVFLFFALKGAAEFREQSLANQYTLMKETQQLLARCVVPGAKLNLPTLPYSPAIEQNPLKK